LICMVELFATKNVRELIPKYEAFIVQELHSMDLALASIPFGDADKVLQQKRQMAKEITKK